MSRTLIFSICAILATTLHADDLAKKIDEALAQRESDIAKRLPQKGLQNSILSIEVMKGGRYKHAGKVITSKKLKKVLLTKDADNTTVMAIVDETLANEDMLDFFKLLAETGFSDVSLERQAKEK